MTLANNIRITPELVRQHGLKPEEYDRFVKLLGREPTLTELGICSAMWNEHCSYKSSKRWLRTLPTKGPRVLQGPGEKRPASSQGRAASGRKSGLCAAASSGWL